MIKIDVVDGNFYLPEIDLWLDPDKKKPFAFISHAHMDHVKNHSKVICTKATHKFLRILHINTALSWLTSIIRSMGI